MRQENVVLVIRLIADDRVAAFVGEKLGTHFIPPFTTMGLEVNGEVVSGVVFHCFEGASVHVTIAGKKWTRSFLRSVGEYIFGTLGCERFTITTEQPHVVHLGQRLGGRIEGLMRSQFGAGRDGYIVGVLKDEYRFK